MRTLVCYCTVYDNTCSTTQRKSNNILRCFLISARSRYGHFVMVTKKTIKDERKEIDTVVGIFSCERYKREEDDLKRETVFMWKLPDNIERIASSMLHQTCYAQYYNTG